jgi:ERAP1-like C-terminal domain
MGFPLVTIERNGSEVFARQDRFLMSPTNDTLNQPTSKFGYKWYIPLSYRTNRYEDGVKQVWMNMTDGMPQNKTKTQSPTFFAQISVSFTLPEDTLWFKANVNQSGFYRVNYDREMWSHLISAMINNSNAFSPADRASLIDDAFTLCRCEANSLIQAKITNGWFQSWSAWPRTAFGNVPVPKARTSLRTVGDGAREHAKLGEALAGVCRLQTVPAAHAGHLKSGRHENRVE